MCVVCCAYMCVYCTNITCKLYISSCIIIYLCFIVKYVALYDSAYATSGHKQHGGDQEFREKMCPVVL